MKNIVVFSGGLDSTVTLALACDKAMPHKPVEAVAFDYGQRHRRELDAARAIAKHYGVRLHVIDVRALIGGESSLLGHGDIPHGHYHADTMRSTVVHGRNLLFASIAISLACERGTVWLGVHGGDHHIYADCTPEFWERVSWAALAYRVGLRVPFLLDSKTDVVRVGATMGAPLALTWSCYEGGVLHCGKCGTCVERREAFELAGVDDPTRYSA